MQVPGGSYFGTGHITAVDLACVFLAGLGAYDCKREACSCHDRFCFVKIREHTLESDDVRCFSRAVADTAGSLDMLRLH